MQGAIPRSDGATSCICSERPDCAVQLAVVEGQDSLAVWRGGGSALQWHCCAVCHSRLFALRFDPDNPATVMRKVGMPAVGMPTPDLCPRVHNQTVNSEAYV